MFKVGSRIQENGTVTGTGPVTLTGATDAMFPFSALLDEGDKTWALIEDADANEICVVTKVGGTLVRGAVIKSTNGDAPVDFLPGPKVVSQTLPGEKVLVVDDAGKVRLIASDADLVTNVETGLYTESRVALARFIGYTDSGHHTQADLFAYLVDGGNGYGSGFTISAARGTPDAPAALVNGDNVGWIQALGHDGVDFRPGPFWDFNVEGVPGADGVMPISATLKMVGGLLGLWNAFEALPDGVVTLADGQLRIETDHTVRTLTPPADADDSDRVATTGWVRNQGYGTGGGGGAPTGAAGGMLSGTYPNPGFAAAGDFSASVNTPAYKIGGVTVISQPIAGFLGLANPASGLVNGFLGGPADKTNYWRNDVHRYQSLDGATEFLSIDSANVTSFLPFSVIRPAVPQFSFWATANAADQKRFDFYLESDGSFKFRALNDLGAVQAAWSLTRDGLFWGLVSPPGAANDTSFATTAWVKALGYTTGSGYLTTASAASTYAPLASPALTGTPTVNGLAVGYMDVPQNSQSGTPYNIVLTDDGKHIYHPSGAAASTYQIPANASVAFPIGATLTFVNDSVNAVTISVTTDTLVLSPGGTTGNRTLAQYGMATALKVGATRWFISGTGLT